MDTVIYVLVAIGLALGMFLLGGVLADIQAPLIEVNANVDIPASRQLEDQVSRFILKTEKATLAALAEYQRLGKQANEKLSEGGDLLSGLRDSVTLLQEEAKAVRGSNYAVQMMAYAVIGAAVLMALMGLMMWRANVKTFILLRGLARSMESFKDIELEENRTLRKTLSGLWRRFKNDSSG